MVLLPVMVMTRNGARVTLRDQDEEEEAEAEDEGEARGGVFSSPPTHYGSSSSLYSAARSSSSP
eukprot:8759862-Pyramimonas_sp.AAC.1